MKSCITTRAGVNWISVDGSASGCHCPRAAIVSAVTLAPSSVLKRFSKRTLWLNGNLSEPVTAPIRKISYVRSPLLVETVSDPRAWKLSMLDTLASC